MNTTNTGFLIDLERFTKRKKFKKMGKNQVFGTKNEKSVQSKPYNRFFLKKKHFFVDRHEK